MLLTPATRGPAFALGAKVGPIGAAMYLNDFFTVTVNLAYLPGLAVPTGLDAGRGCLWDCRSSAKPLTKLRFCAPRLPRHHRAGPRRFYRQTPGLRGGPHEQEDHRSSANRHTVGDPSSAWKSMPRCSPNQSCSPAPRPASAPSRTAMSASWTRACRACCRSGTGEASSRRSAMSLGLKAKINNNRSVFDRKRLFLSPICRAGLSLISQFTEPDRGRGRGVHRHAGRRDRAQSASSGCIGSRTRARACTTSTPTIPMSTSTAPASR